MSSSLPHPTQEKPKTKKTEIETKNNQSSFFRKFLFHPLKVLMKIKPHLLESQNIKQAWKKHLH